MAGYEDVWRNYFLKQNTTSNDQFKRFLGSNFDYLQNNLKQGIEGQNPIFSQLFGNAARRIGASTDKAIRNIKEQGAQSGFRGASGNLINNAFGNEQNALSQVSDDLAARQLSYQQNAIAQLLGLNQFEGGQTFNAFQSDRQNLQFQQNLAEQRRQFDEQMAYQRDQASLSFGDVLGGILGMGAGALGGGFLGGLGARWAK